MVRIKLTKGYEALVDDEDGGLAANTYWASVNGPKHVYVARYYKEGTRRYRRGYLHRDVVERMSGPIPPGMVVDHINGDTLDNRRANLRLVTHQQNLWNQHGAGRDSQTGVRGVRERKGRWTAYICEGRKMHHLGVFATMEEAREARRKAEIERSEALAA